MSPVAFRAGDHACLLYASRHEQREAVMASLRGALRAGERVLYILDQDADSGVLEEAQRQGVEVEDALDDGALVVRAAEEVYLPDGRFEPRRVLDALAHGEQEARREGFRGLHALAEMTWAREGVPGVHLLPAYEQQLNEAFPGLAASAVCQYDARVLEPGALREVLRAHPLRAEGGLRAENPEFATR